ncbi:MAG: replication initiator protein A, partial [Stellaceae bacterium]
MSERTISGQRSAKNSKNADKLYIENNLLRVAGALFCHDQKRAATRTGEIKLNPGIPEKRIVIRPDPKLGQPGPLAHKVFVALIKKHSDHGRPVSNEISFTRREMGRLIGRKDWGGKDSEQLSRALHEIHYTFIKTHFKKTGARYVEHSFNIFPQIWIERREFESDPIEACTVMLADPIIQSLQEDHFVCLNHALMQQLGTIGQALYMRLFFHFANLYTSPAQHLAFQTDIPRIPGRLDAIFRPQGLRDNEIRSQPNRLPAKTARCSASR